MILVPNSDLVSVFFIWLEFFFRMLPNFVWDLYEIGNAECSDW